jgi:hypothetical protein
MSANQFSHEQNVVSLGVEITRVNTFGAAYNPSRDDLKIPGLNQLKANGDAVITSWNNADNLFKKAIAARTLAFSDMDRLVTRAINAFRISGVPPKSIEQAEAIVRDIRGERASDKLTDEEIAAAKEEGKDLKQVVVHNSSYDSRTSSYRKFVQYVGAEDKYRPNEADISHAGLNAKLAALEAATYNYNTAGAALEAARLVRDTLLYTETSGLVDIGLAVKSYVKSAFGADSPQYKQISDILFVTRG